MTQLLMDVNSAAKNVGKDKTVYNRIDVREYNLDPEYYYLHL